MSNPFGPAAQPAAPGNPFGPAPQQAPAAAPAPPAYAPPAPQQAPAPAAPAYYGNPGQPGSSQWPAGAQPAAAPALGAFGRPPAPSIGGGTGADLAAMYGRLVLIFPLSISTVPRNPKFITEEQRLRGDVNQQRMTATFVVLDGSNPIAYGGDMYSMPQKPHTKSEPLPHVSKALWVSQSKLIEQCGAALQLVAQAGPGGDAMVLGRLLRGGNEANSPWILGDYSPEDERVAAYYLEGVKSGQFPNPLQ